VYLAGCRPENLGRDQDALGSFSHRRPLDRDQSQVLVEIFPELTFLHTLVQITICRGHDANVHLNGLDRAEVLHLSFLQEAKQLGMTSKGSSRSHLETMFPHNTPRSCPAYAAALR
jgi:hypothetical protein